MSPDPLMERRGGGPFKQPGSVPCSEDGLQDVGFNEASGLAVVWKSGSKEGRSQGLGVIGVGQQ